MHSEAISESLGGEKREILVVDNDERIVELVSWFLLKRGYSVRSAETFDLARQMLVERPVDLMLSDIDMGVESALDVLPRFHREGILPPTLVFSGYLDAKNQDLLLALDPVVGTLAKPVAFHVLEACVVDYFKGRSLSEHCRVSSAPVPRSAPDLSVTPATSLPSRSPAAEPQGPQGDDEWVEIVPGQGSSSSGF
ncbi:MAG: DNA-binding NtrC family response regulator [Planctomycetota bacterium]|jgi:DNA-binding NtrC family response regulator